MQLSVSKKTAETLHRRRVSWLARHALAAGFAAGTTILGNAAVGPRGAGRRQGRAGLDRRRRPRHQFVRRLSQPRRLPHRLDGRRRPPPGGSRRGRGGQEAVRRRPPKAVQDFRKVLDRKEVDAVIVATPDHWHALATIWACQAGKDVYVEKPPTHNCWEGRKMIEAARKYQPHRPGGHAEPQCPVQHGGQEIHRGRQARARSTSAASSTRSSGRTFPPLPDSDPPAGFDWDLFNGPAPQAAFNANYRGNWHHFWRYSGGDIVNDAIHQLDLARWLLGVEYPKAVYSHRRAVRREGAAETPDTQLAVYDFDDLRLSFELTLYTPYMLKISPLIRESDDRVSLLAAMRHADRNLRQRGADGRRPARRRLAGLRAAETPRAAWSRPSARAAFPIPSTRRTSSTACGRGRPPTPTSKKAIAARSCRTWRTSAIGWAVRNLSSTRGRKPLSATMRRRNSAGGKYRKPYVIDDAV